MRRYFDKVIGLSMTAVMVLGMSSCGESNVDTNSTTESTKASITQATETTTTVKELTEGEKLAEKYNGFIETPMNLGGRTIRVLSSAAGKYSLKNDANGNPSRDATTNEGLMIVDAIEEIKKDYNCDFVFEQLKGSAMVEALITAKAAGDTYCDILEFAVSDTYLDQIYSNNICIPLEKEEINSIVGLYENPWLQQTAFGNMFGHQYGVHFKVANSSDILRGVCVFNKELVEKYNLGNIYQMVKDKTWTFDKFREICASVLSQSNGEVYGMTYNQESIAVPMFVFANGGTFTENTAAGYQYTALSDNTLEALNYLVDLAKSGYISPNANVVSTIETNYANGDAVFMFGNYAALKKYKNGTIETTYTFGMVPAPLGPNGEDYNAVSYTDALFHIVNGTDKPQEVAAILMAMANRTSKNSETMVEQELMNTLFDEESGEMLQLMYDNMKCDFSRVMTAGRNNLSSAIMSTLKRKDALEFTFEKTPKEALESIEQTMQTAFDSVVLQE